MLSVVFDARAEDFDVDAFLAEFALCDEEHVFRRGQKWSDRYPPHKASGIRFAVFDESDSLDEAMGAVRRFVIEQREALNRLRELKIAAEVDFGFGVGPGEGTLAASLSFPPEFLQLLGGLGISLEATCFVCSDP